MMLASLNSMGARPWTRAWFKARIHDEQRDHGVSGPEPARDSDAPDLFAAYVEAARSCGQDVSKLTREQLASVVDKQRDALRKKLGCDDVDFRVIVRDGKVKLKASTARD